VSDQRDDPRSEGDLPLFLRVTIRCLAEDLERTTARDAESPVEEIDNELVRKFVAMRSQDPRGTEKIQPLMSDAEVYSLHSGRWRGATWHDREHQTVWLVAGRFHASGKRDDAYPHFKGLDEAARLFPTEDDYALLLAMQAETFVDHVMERAPQILEDARRQSPTEVEAIVGTIPISVAVLKEDGIEFVYLAVTMSEWSDDGPEPPAEWTTILWAAFFPWVGDPVTEIDLSNEIAGRPIKDGELIYVSIWEG
jgi:hypothetical protein